MEYWLSLPSPSPYAGRYEASNEGRIRNVETNRILTPYLRGGYLGVTLHAKTGERSTPSIHHLVLAAFKGNRPDGLVGAHLDGDVTNNRADNLAWVTKEENERHKITHGTVAEGERNGNAKFTNLQVACIREAHKLGLSVDKIGIITGVYGATINNIVKGASFRPQHESPVTEGQAPTPIPDSLHTQTGREGGEKTPSEGTPTEIG